MSAALVEVTQAARDAASDAFYTLPKSQWPAAVWMAEMENGEHDDAPMVQTFARAIHEAELRGAGLMQEAAAKLCDAEGAYEQEGYGLNRGTQNYFRARNAIRALDPATIIARATLTETSDDR